MRRIPGLVCVAALSVPLAVPASASPPDSTHLYVTDSIRIGSTAAEAASYAFDLNHDRRTDNWLGIVLAGLIGFVDVNGSIAAGLASDAVEVLHSVDARSLSTGGATWTLSGDGSSDLLRGWIVAGGFRSLPGEITLPFALDEEGQPVVLDLVDGRLAATCDAEGCTGRVGGGVPVAQVDQVVLPWLAAGLQAVVDATCPDACSSQAELILQLFDVDQNENVTADELRQNAVIQAVFTPDLDLVRGGGNDHLSFAVGFTASAS